MIGVTATVKTISSKRKELIARYKQMDNSYTTIGVHKGAGKYKGKGAPAVGQVAFWLEYGTRKMPSRSFMRMTLYEARGDLEDFIVKIIPKVSSGKVLVKEALDKIGFFVQTRIQNKIKTANEWARPLKERYARYKYWKYRSAYILIRTGLLLRSISFRSKVIK